MERFGVSELLERRNQLGYLLSSTSSFQVISIALSPTASPLYNGSFHGKMYQWSIPQYTQYPQYNQEIGMLSAKYMTY